MILSDSPRIQYFHLCFILLSYICSTQAGTCFSRPDSLAVLQDASAANNLPGSEASCDIETPRRNHRNVEALRGQVFDGIPLRGTSLYASVILKERIPLAKSSKGSSIAQLAYRLANLVVSMGKDELWTRVDIWPTFPNPLKLEIKEGPDQRGERLPLNKSFLGHFAAFLLNEMSLGGNTFDYAFIGNITTSIGSVVFPFRVFEVDPARTLPERNSNVNFGRQDLRAIFAAKDQIVDRTSPEDILLFLGNTAAFIYYAISGERQAYQIPMSGWPLGRPPISITNEEHFTRDGLANFKDTILADAFSHISTLSRIILIDHARTGTALAEFSLLLRSPKHFSLVPTSQKIYFINLAYPGIPKGQKDLGPPMELAEIEFFPELPNVVVPTLARYDYGLVGRIVPNYPAEYWEADWRQVPNPDEGTAKVILNKIQARKEDIAKSRETEKERLSRKKVDLSLFHTNRIM